MQQMQQQQQQQQQQQASASSVVITLPTVNQTTPANKSGKQVVIGLTTAVVFAHLPTWYMRTWFYIFVLGYLELYSFDELVAGRFTSLGVVCCNYYFLSVFVNCHRQTKSFSWYFNCCVSLGLTLHVFLTGKTKLSLVKKNSTTVPTGADGNTIGDGVAAVAYVDSNGMLSIVPANSATQCNSQTEMYDDGDNMQNNRRLRRIACSCPNCRDATKK